MSVCIIRGVTPEEYPCLQCGTVTLDDIEMQIAALQLPGCKVYIYSVSDKPLSLICNNIGGNVSFTYTYFPLGKVYGLGCYVI